jgi:hypothetical protein
VYSITPPNRTLVIRNSIYPDLLGPSGKFVENSTKLTFLEITGYRIKYSAVECYGFLNLKFFVVGRFRRRYIPSTLTAELQTTTFSKKNPVIRIFCISRMASRL